MLGHGQPWGVRSGASRRVLHICAVQGWPTVPADPDRALRALLAPGATTVVALDDDGAVVGFAHALRDGVTAAQLLVTPEHRGRGLGRQMLAEAFQRCRVDRMDVITDTALRQGLSYSSIAPPIRRRCRRKVYDGSAARRAR
jgi:GNAT superfamily N-acetyltransferase